MFNPCAGDIPKILHYCSLQTHNGSECPSIHWAWLRFFSATLGSSAGSVGTTPGCPTSHNASASRLDSSTVAAVCHRSLGIANCCWYFTGVARPHSRAAKLEELLLIIHTCWCHDCCSQLLINQQFQEKTIVWFHVSLLIKHTAIVSTNCSW